jgi:hypothetical protein
MGGGKVCEFSSVRHSCLGRVRESELLGRKAVSECSQSVSEHSAVLVQCGHILR